MKNMSEMNNRDWGSAMLMVPTVIMFIFINLLPILFKNYWFYLMTIPVTVLFFYGINKMKQAFRED